MEFGEVRTFVTAAAFLHAFSLTIFIYAVYEPVCVYFMNAYVDLYMLCHCPCSKFSIKFYLFIYLFIFYLFILFINVFSIFYTFCCIHQSVNTNCNYLLIEVLQNIHL